MGDGAMFVANDDCHLYQSRGDLKGRLGHGSGGEREQQEFSHGNQYIRANIRRQRRDYLGMALM